MNDPDGGHFDYHLFVSYTRTPDGGLARELERFLEGFHAALPATAGATSLPALRVCVDGSDFHMPPPGEAGRGDRHRRDVSNVVREHLARSRELLLLCSRRAAHTHWVEEELRWFIEHRGAGSVRLAFTEGDDQGGDPETWFPAAVREARITGNLAYDLRGYDERRAREWRQVADFNRQLVRLAADLHGVSGGELYPTWLEGELARARAQSLELVTSARFETLAGDPTRALLKAVEAHEIHPAPETEGALRDAYRVAVLHHYNRRETSVLSGAGPGYLAARWKQGEVFVKTSPDGRYRLLVTERGKDGPRPAGDVYLVSNESQRVIELKSTRASRARVEDVAFDQDSRRVLVTRYFDLTVYGLAGEVLGEYTFSRHTKSPVHLLAGLFRGRYVIGAETKGGLWLVDPAAGPQATIKVLGEWHRDASLAVAIAPGGECAAVVFESGRVALLTLDDAGAALLVDLPHPGALYAGWRTADDDCLVTAGGDGIVRLWETGTGTPALRLQSERVAPAIDWVAASEDGRRLCAVGADRRLYLLDGEHGHHLYTLDHDADIDWAALRTVRLPGEAPPLPLHEAQAEVAWPDGELPVTDRFELGDQAWFVTEEPGEGEYALSIRKAWRIEGDVARLYATHVSRVTRHADLLWLHSSFGGGGIALWADGDSLRRFPAEPVSVLVMMAEADVVWLGSERGGFCHRGNEHRLVTPADAKVNLIERIAGRLWFGTTAGAFVVEDGRTLRISDPFVNVTTIKQAGGHTWLLTRADTGGFISTEGPAFVVEGCFARALPAANVPVGNVLEAAGFAWLCTEQALHRFDGTELRTVTGLDKPASALVADGDTLLVKTAAWGLWPTDGPVYRLDPKRLTLTTADTAR